MGQEILALALKRKFVLRWIIKALTFVEKNLPHIRNILLAVSIPNNESLSVDIVIGVDYYWSIGEG